MAAVAIKAAGRDFKVLGRLRMILIRKVLGLPHNADFKGRGIGRGSIHWFGGEFGGCARVFHVMTPGATIFVIVLPISSGGSSLKCEVQPFAGWLGRWGG